jgi:phenylpropionate dioxygenase-like ring-hydroxylating dioxygenase large terminal subunit
MLLVRQSASGQALTHGARAAVARRQAPLSEGRVEADGTLMCAYHAWRFDGRGSCTAIPQALNKQQEAAAARHPRACATAFPTRVEQV